MTHIILEVEKLLEVIEDFAMKHLHMGGYKVVKEAKADLHADLMAAGIPTNHAVTLESTVGEAPVALAEPVVTETPVA